MFDLIKNNIREVISILALIVSSIGLAILILTFRHNTKSKVRVDKNYLLVSTEYLEKDNSGNLYYFIDIDATNKSGKNVTFKGFRTKKDSRFARLIINNTLINGNNVVNFYKAEDSLSKITNLLEYVKDRNIYKFDDIGNINIDIQAGSTITLRYIMEVIAEIPNNGVILEIIADFNNSFQYDLSIAIDVPKN